MENYDLHLEIITPEDIVFNGTVRLVQVPGDSGTFTIMRRHSPIVAVLGNGRIRIVDESGTENTYNCEGGVLKCQDNLVTILLRKVSQ